MLQDGLWLLLSDPGLIKGYSKAILTPNAIEFARLQETVVRYLDYFSKISVLVFQSLYYNSFS